MAVSSTIAIDYRLLLLLIIIPIAPMQRYNILSPAPRKNKMQLTIASKMLNNSNLGKPYKLFFLGAGENRKLGVYYLLLL